MPIFPPGVYQGLYSQCPHAERRSQCFHQSQASTPSISLNPVSTLLYHRPLSSNSSPRPLSASSFLLLASCAAATVAAFCASKGLSSFSSSSNSPVFRGKDCCKLLSCLFNSSNSACRDVTISRVAGRGKVREGLVDGLLCRARRSIRVSCREEICAGRAESWAVWSEIFS